MSTRYKFIKTLESLHTDQVRGLYTDDGAGWIVISTVSLDRPELVRDVRMAMGALAGQATSGEETMAFHCDADGRVTDWEEIESANGEGSRAEVLRALGCSDEPGCTT